MGKILISGIRCRTRIGISDQERSRPQQLVVDVELELSLGAACERDDITMTVDYDELTRDIVRQVESVSHRLVEAVAGKICLTALRDSRVHTVRVRVRKSPSALADRIDHVTVEVERRQKS